MVVVVMRMGRTRSSVPFRMDSLKGKPGLPPDLVDVVHQKDGVVHHDPSHHDHPDVRLPGEGGVGVEEHEEHADEGHGHGEEHAEGLDHGLEEGRRHHEDEEDGDGQDEVDLLPLLLGPPPGDRSP